MPVITSTERHDAVFARHLKPYMSPAKEQELYLANLGLARMMSKKFIRGIQKIEDHPVYSDACFGLLMAVRKYDPFYGTEFSTYAVPIIRNTILGPIIRDKEINKVVAFSDKVPDVVDSKQNYTILIEAYQKVIDFVEKTFTSKDQDIFRKYFLNSKTQKEIAAEHGITQQRVNQKLAKIFEKIKNEEVVPFVENSISMQE